MGNMEIRKLLEVKIRSFTLQELLIVLVIIGILVLLALPSLMPLISKTKSTEAKLQLEHVYNLQKMHFMEYSKFSDNLEKISFEHAPLKIKTQMPYLSGKEILKCPFLSGFLVTN